MENQEQENKVDESDIKCCQNSKKILNIVYLIIFLCIAIWIAFYINQNKSTLIKVQNNEKTLSGETNLATWSLNVTSDNNTWTTSNSTWNITSTWETNLNTNNSWTISASWTVKTEEDKKNEEAIIKDFEKELDSLFDVIDQNAK